MASMLNPGADQDGGARGSVGKKEVSHFLQGAAPRPHCPYQLLAKGQPVEFAGFRATAGLSPFSCFLLRLILTLATVAFKPQAHGQGQLGPSGTV